MMMAPMPVTIAKKKDGQKWKYKQYEGGQHEEIQFSDLRNIPQESRDKSGSQRDSINDYQLRQARKKMIQQQMQND